MCNRLVVVCFLLLGVLSSLDAGVFSKMTEDHWAFSSVANLAKKGIIAAESFKGFNGEKKLSRYEFAITLSRFVAYVARKINDGIYSPSKEDLKQLNDLCDEFELELKLVGFKYDNLDWDILTVKRMYPISNSGKIITLYLKKQCN